MSAERRVRSTNFSKVEELLLLQEIRKYKNIIECKSLNKISNKEKENAWDEIKNAFNAKNIEYRSLSQIKSKYDNLKTKARKQIARYKAHLKDSENNVAITVDLDAVTKIMLDIISVKKSADHNYLHAEDVNLCNSISECWTVNSQIEMLKLAHISEPSVSLLHQDIVDVKAVKVEVEDNGCNSKFVDRPHDFNLTEVENDGINFESNIPSCSSSGTKGISETQLRKRFNSRRSNHFNYQKLKKKIGEKLRFANQKVSCPTKEMYYKRKLELLEKSEELEMTERKKRYQREAEEHRKKMILLDLDIQLRQKQMEKFNC